MKRARLLCGLAGLALAVGFAGGQAPPDPKPTSELAGGVTPDTGKKSLEEAIAAAMKNNPDVRVAEAEVQVAQAKLAQAKLAVAQKVAAAHAAIDRAKAEATAAEAEYSRVAPLVKKGFVAQGEADAARGKLEAAKAAVAKAEAESNALLGVMPGQHAAVQWKNLQHAELTLQPRLWERSVILENVVDHGIVMLAGAKPAPGSVAERLREALDKAVKLDDQKNADLGAILGTLTKAAGLDVRVRVQSREDPNVWKDAVRLTLSGGEYSLGTWFQLVTDEAGLAIGSPTEPPVGPARRPGRYEIYVRDYGLLLADAETAPPGAVTVQDFWKQVRAEKAKEAKKAEPKK
jgi:hypothetical protein